MIYKMSLTSKLVDSSTLQIANLTFAAEPNMEGRHSGQGYEEELNSHRRESGTPLKSIVELMAKNSSGLLKCIYIYIYIVILPFPGMVGECPSVFHHF
jgi:hypothetical protein